jgi:pimeloyl-ACP methyl ester carboxylesterase
VRGADSQFVSNQDADEFAHTAPGFRGVHVVADSGHSVQSDQPLALIGILRRVLAAS